MLQLAGEFSLCLAVLVAAGSVLCAVAAVRLQSAVALRALRWSIWGVALALTAASAVLVVALIRSDFRFEYVASYTERALPWGYKLAAFWAGQQGSLLLWGWLLAVMGAIAVTGFRRLGRTEQAATAATLAVVCGFFAALMLFAANPFATFASAAPPDGRGLNPMLQDPGMIAHPPILFLGYSGCTIPFAVLLGVLVAGRRDNRWLTAIRRWLLVAWLFLTGGIVLGAWWAYIELGWGGYWAWDPVENASLLPWLTATALLHSIMVQQHRGMFKVWNAILIALTFLLCIVGTYITRSGVIDSVHAFAPSLVGTFFLVFLGATVAITAGLLVWRRSQLRPEHRLEGLVSREGAFLLVNALLVIMMATTLVGTLFPLISSAAGMGAVTVKPPFYNKVVAPMGLVLVAVMTVAPVLAFGRSAATRIARALLVPSIVSGAVTAGTALLVTTNIWALLCTAITALGTAAVVAGFAGSLSARRRSTGEGWAAAAARLIDRDHRRYGGQLAHLGIMLLVLGVAGSSLFKIERTLRLHPGESAMVGDYQVTFASLEDHRAVNYTAVRANVMLREPDGVVQRLRPECRFYDAWKGEPNTEVSIRSTWRDDVYVSLAGWEDGGYTTAIQVKVNPLVTWIWTGGIVMVVGGLFAMTPRLLRLPHAATVPAGEPRVMPGEPAMTRIASEAAS